MPCLLTLDTHFDFEIIKQHFIKPSISRFVYERSLCEINIYFTTEIKVLRTYATSKPDHSVTQSSSSSSLPTQTWKLQQSQEEL